MAFSRNASFTVSLLLFLLISFFQPSFQQPLCHEFERLALLQFKNSFSIEKNASGEPLAYPKTNLWKSQGIDCCSWEGITCDQQTGRVIGVDLRSSCLFGSINSSNSLFRLDHLQYLNLADNDFHFSEIPSALGNLSRLTYLNLSESVFSGQVPFEISKLSKLTILDLSWNTDYSGNQRLLELKTPHWKSLIQNLSRLEYLDLSVVNITSPIPSALANLSSLMYLGLSHCGLLGKFSDTIFELSKLESLYAHANWGLAGTLPEFYLSNPLKELSVAETNFSGEFPKSLGLLSSLEYLNVANCNFSGVLPSSLSNLTKLRTFSLYDNSFQGSVAPFFSNLTQLDYVDIGSNHFTFTKIPSLARSTNLRHLNLSDNQITAPFPSWLTNLTQLTYLNLGFNMIQGSLPSSISKLKNLESFFVADNNLSGIVELNTLLRLKNLKKLSLSGNSFSLLIKNSNNSTDNTKTPKFVFLDLGGCNLKEFPAFLHNQDELEDLILCYNKIPGIIPKWLLKMSSNLLILDLSHNSLTSFEDFDSTLTSSLDFLNIGFNFFKGPLPIPPPSIVYYSVASNSFEGEIPIEFCNMASLEYLDLSRNTLSGFIPMCLGNHNKSLSYLNLGGNNFRGKIPRSLANCKDLELLDLGNNQIRDTFPLWLGVLPHLEVIILQSNGLYGAISGGSESNDTLLFPDLRIIDLSHNRFQGPLPLKYFRRWNALPNLDDKRATYLGAEYFGNSSKLAYGFSYSMTVTNKGKETTYEKILNIFTAIDLSCNNFSGAIPQVVGNLRKLELLNLSNNALDGLIPPALENLSNLEALDLSNNNLTGRIPAQLAQLTFLEVFNVSNNQLTGPIPQGRQFDTFENNSFQGNPGLCGMPLSKKCGRPLAPPSSSKEDGHTSLLEEIGWKAVLIGIGCGFLGGVALGIKVYSIKQEWLMETFLARQGRRQRRGVRRLTTQTQRR